jgi:hypothetical protein
MVMASLLVAAALQAAIPSPSSQAEICSLITPSGEVIHFAAMAWSQDGSRLGLAPVGGSVWPADAIVGTRSSAAAGGFIFGHGAGISFELSERVAGRTDRSATLFGHEGRGLPLAFGFCQLGPAPDVADAIDTVAQPASVGANIAAFDSQHWPRNHCALLLTDGRRMRFTHAISGRDQMRLSSAELWPGGPVTVAIRPTPKNATGIFFGREGGPEGVETAVAVPPLATVLFRIAQLGAPAAQELIAYGICGEHLVRRPVGSPVEVTQ